MTPTLVHYILCSSSSYSTSKPKGPVWFEGREGKGRGGREWKGGGGFNVTLFGLIRKKEWNGRGGENFMIICLVKEGRGG